MFHKNTLARVYKRLKKNLHTCAALRVVFFLPPLQAPPPPSIVAREPATLRAHNGRVGLFCFTRSLIPHSPLSLAPKPANVQAKPAGLLLGAIGASSFARLRRAATLVFPTVSLRANSRLHLVEYHCGELHAAGRRATRRRLAPLHFVPLNYLPFLNRQRPRPPPLKNTRKFHSPVRAKYE